MRMVHVLVSYEDEVVVSQWMCYLNAFGHENGTCIGKLRGESVDVLFECLFRHENGTCIGYKDEVVSQWMCYSNAFSGMRMVHVLARRMRWW